LLANTLLGIHAQNGTHRGRGDFLEASNLFERLLGTAARTRGIDK
jgi:hypothetical protein